MSRISGSAVGLGGQPPGPTRRLPGFPPTRPVWANCNASALAFFVASFSATDIDQSRN
jgi:hypothetical protein